MMMERFASATDDILMSIAIERELLTLVAIAGDSQTGRSRNLAARHDRMVPCQLTMVIFTITTKVIRTVFAVVYGFSRSSNQGTWSTLILTEFIRPVECRHRHVFPDLKIKSDMFEIYILCKKYLAIFIFFASFLPTKVQNRVHFNCNDENRILGK